MRQVTYIMEWFSLHELNRIKSKLGALVEEGIPIPQLYIQALDRAILFKEKDINLSKMEDEENKAAMIGLGVLLDDLNIIVMTKQRWYSKQ